jgi:manganese-dependent inorganic pyrophosphatase
MVKKLMNNIVVTTGLSYTDVDGLACVLVYSELLKFEGNYDSVTAYLPGKLIANCPSEFSNQIKDKYVNVLGDEQYQSKFVLQDICNALKIDTKIPVQNIMEVYDHHVYGDEKYWLEERADVHSVIEPIGACATLVWRECKKRGYSEKLDLTLATILLLAIYSNTLHFKAEITNPEDIESAKEIQSIYGISDQLINDYFIAVQDRIIDKFDDEIDADAKYSEFNSKKYYIAQIEFWDCSKWLIESKQRILAKLLDINADYKFFTFPMIDEDRNFIMTDDKKTQNYLVQHFGGKFVDSIMITNGLILRKEIKKVLFTNN